MKRSATVFVLLALLALVPCAQCLAQAPAAATPPAGSVTAAAPASVADFLETLSSGAPGIEGQTPSPKPMSTFCTTNADCPIGWLCCYPCGIDDCNKICMHVKRCPLFV